RSKRSAAIKFIAFMRDESIMETASRREAGSDLRRGRAEEWPCGHDSPVIRRCFTASRNQLGTCVPEDIMPIILTPSEKALRDRAEAASRHYHELASKLSDRLSVFEAWL